VPSGTALVPGKLYLRLYHGRTKPDEQLQDWGFDGPMFGPLAGYIHTYCSTFRLIGEDHAEEIWLETHGDLIAWNGSYYGDLEVFVAGPSDKVLGDQATRPKTENTLRAPWTLHFDRDGTEDIAIIRDADGHDLANSRHFWRPEGNDPVPGTLAAMRAMKAAPQMLKALTAAEAFVRGFEGDERQDGIEALLAAIRGAIAEANGTPDARAAKSPSPIIIKVRGGVVQDVRNVPPVCEYLIVDYDDLQEQGTLKPMVSPALPPDPEGMNEARLGWAAQAVRAFQEATGADDEDALSDLLADLMHWADRNKYDFDAALLRARDHYHAETLGDGG
jgi:hypothetical protein